MQQSHSSLIASVLVTSEMRWRSSRESLVLPARRMLGCALMSSSHVTLGESAARIPRLRYRATVTRTELGSLVLCLQAENDDGVAERR